MICVSKISRRFELKKSKNKKKFDDLAVDLL